MNNLERIRGMLCAMTGERIAVRNCDGCWGPTEANHATYGVRGKGQKADNSLLFPLCLKHHTDWHDGKGYFWGWPKAVRVVFEREMLKAYAEEQSEEYF